MPFNKPLSRFGLLLPLALAFGILMILAYASLESHTDTRTIAELPYQIGDKVAVIENDTEGKIVGHSLADKDIEADKKVYLFEVRFEDGSTRQYRAIELRHAD